MGNGPLSTLPFPSLEQPFPPRRLPLVHKFALGDRIIANLYELLEGLVAARYGREKLPLLKAHAARLDLL